MKLSIPCVAHLETIAGQAKGAHREDRPNGFSGGFHSAQERWRWRPILRLTRFRCSKYRTCLELSFAAAKDWDDIHSAEQQARNQIVATKGSSILAWGDEQTLRRAFGKDLTSLSPYSIKDRLQDYANNLYLKGFIERAIGLSLIRGKPLLMEDWRGGSVLILDRQRPNLTLTKNISQCVGSLHGRIDGMVSAITPEHPKSEEVWGRRRSGSRWMKLTAGSGPS
ncbi:hypothetical protein [Bradyrhizobium cosmicum]|uniref:hypothetical protein n=1 Tax=Bradyrhizobium cosmicum TaxID=1404864 RepID=UPI0028E877D3|nr:hypothetical protein [Bradyrhizobium cosmicum]